MNKVFKRLILAIVILAISFSFTEAQSSVDGEYFSNRFKEGNVLSWEATYRTVEPQEEVIGPYGFTITIKQDISDEPITSDTFQNYFDINYNGLNYTSWYMLNLLIVPILYIQDGTSLTIHEHYVTAYEDSEDHEIEHSFGDTIVTITPSISDTEWITTIEIDDETGIIRKTTHHITTYENNEIVHEVIDETVYKGGIELTSTGTSTIIIAILGIPLVYVIRKRNEVNQPSS